MALHTIDQTLKAGAPGGAFMDAAGRPPTFYHACPVDWTVHIRGEDGATISGLTDDYVSAVLKLSEAVTSAEPLRTLTVAAGNDPVFALSADDATLVAEGAEARDLWAVVYLLNASGVQVPVGCGKVRCVASGAQAVGATSDPDSAGLTSAEVLALILANGGDGEEGGATATFSNGFLMISATDGHTYRVGAVLVS